MITLKELRKKTMPPEKRASASRCIVGHYLVRPISDIISIPLIEKGVSATKVTIFSGLFPIISLFSFIFLKDSRGFWIGWIGLLIWNILDGVDGNIARYTGTCSKTGEMWDVTVGWFAIIPFYLGMGMVAFYSSGVLSISIDKYFYILMGAIATIADIFPRLLMQKKNVLMGADSVKEIKQRTNYGFLKLTYFNITSINGLAAVIFALSYIFGLMDLCVIFYFFINTSMAIGVIYKLLKA